MISRRQILQDSATAAQSVSVASALAQPDTVQRLVGFNVLTQSSTSAYLTRLLDPDITRQGNVIQRAGIHQHHEDGETPYV